MCDGILTADTRTGTPNSASRLCDIPTQANLFDNPLPTLAIDIGIGIGIGIETETEIEIEIEIEIKY